MIIKTFLSFLVIAFIIFIVYLTFSRKRERIFSKVKLVNYTIDWKEYEDAFFNTIENYISKNIDKTKGNIDNYFVYGRLGMLYKGFCTLFVTRYLKTKPKNPADDEKLTILYNYIVEYSENIMSFVNTAETWTGNADPIWPLTENVADTVAVAEQAYICGNLLIGVMCMDLYEGSRSTLSESIITQTYNIHDYLETNVVKIRGEMLWYGSTPASSNKNKVIPWNQAFMLAHMYNQLLNLNLGNRDYFNDRLSKIFTSFKKYITVDSSGTHLWHYEQARTLEGDKWMFEDTNHGNLDFNGFYIGYVRGFISPELFDNLFKTILKARSHDCQFSKYIDGTGGKDQVYMRENYMYGFIFNDLTKYKFLDLCLLPYPSMNALLARITSGIATTVV